MKRIWLLTLGSCLWAQNHDLIYPPSLPSSFELSLEESAAISRQGEVASSGVPIPRSLALTNTSSFAITTNTGTPVPASFEVLARWNAPLNETTAPIQWLLVTFVANVAASSVSNYVLIVNGSVANPTPVSPLTVTQITSGPDLVQVVVDTGAAVFSIGLNADQLFDSIEIGGTQLISDSSMTVSVLDEDTSGSQTFSHSTIDEIEIERQSPLSATIVVRGRYDMDNRGDSPAGGLASERRYQFQLDSPTALIRHVISWYGSYCNLQNEWPYVECDDGFGNTIPNGIRLEQARCLLVLASTPISALSRASSSGSTLSEAFSGGSFSITQMLRADRFAARAYEMITPIAGTEAGEAADRAMLAAIGTNHSLAIALNRMDLYEPQQLSILADGSMAIDLVSEGVWLSGRQGLFSEYAVTAVSNLETTPDEATLDRELWAPLNRPLHPWPSSQWFAASNTVEPFPWLPLQGALAQYDDVMARVMANTRDNIAFKGLFGLTTYGSYPRYWADAVRSDELDCDDITPTYDWDNAFWCGAWTDYHNTISAVPNWVMRSGETHWLDTLAFPGAKRMLYTQVMQCDSSDGWFYCGQAPAGYGGFRRDFNSSHAYMDNLVLYYWMTGDKSVIRRLQNGAESMRSFLCVSRPGSACGPEDTIQDYWAQLTGRSTSQWYRVFRFLGLASDDGSFLEDWHNNLARALTQHYVEQQWADDNQDYGFWLVGDQGAYPYFCPPWRDPGDPSDNPNRRYWTDQLWMSALYDLQNVYTLKQGTNDEPLGVPAILPSQVIAATARMYSRFASTLAGAAGNPAGDWPNLLWLLFDESNRIGGIANEPCSTDHPADNPPCINRNPPGATSLAAADPTAPCVEYAAVGGDPLLYDTGKASLTANLVRGGLIAEDTTVIEMGRSMTEFVLPIIWNQVDGQGGGTQTIGSPYGLSLGKLMGEYLARLHSAVALLSAYDAGITNCGYVSVIGGSAVDCEDVLALVSWWNDALPLHPSAQDLNGNDRIDVVELIAAMGCAQNCP